MRMSSTSDASRARVRKTMATVGPCVGCVNVLTRDVLYRRDADRVHIYRISLTIFVAVDDCNHPLALFRGL